MSDRILAWADRLIRIAWVCVVVYALGMLARRRGGARNLEGVAMNDGELSAGRELDALVAEKVMGWTITAPSWGNHVVAGPFADCECPSHRQASNLPHYSTDIAAAWEVVGKVNAVFGFADLILGLYPERGMYYEDIADAMAFRAFLGDPAAPLAICRAALKAVVP